jgi:hypothetical protein
MYDYSGLPEGLQGGMQLFLEKGISPGSFLTACLENDLIGAVNRADPECLTRLPAIVRWINWQIPNHAWGSRERVARWRTAQTIHELSNCDSFARS